MNKNIKIISLIILTILNLSLFLGCTKLTKENVNLKVVNNSPENIQNISHKTSNSSGGVSRADGSFIKSKDSTLFYIENNKFSLGFTDEQGNYFESNEFNIDFNNEKNLPVIISLEKNNSGQWEFNKK